MPQRSYKPGKTFLISWELEGSSVLHQQAVGLRMTGLQISYLSHPCVCYIKPIWEEQVTGLLFTSESLLVTQVMVTLWTLRLVNISLFRFLLNHATSSLKWKLITKDSEIEALKMLKRDHSHHHVLQNTGFSIYGCSSVFAADILLV